MPVAELLLRGQRRLVAKGGDHFNVLLGLRAPTAGNRPVAEHIDQREEAIPLAGEDVEDAVLEHGEVRQLLQVVGGQIFRRGQRHGKEPLAFAIEPRVDEPALRPLAEKDAQAPALGNVFLQGRAGRFVQRIDVQQIDRPELVQRVAAQKAGVSIFGLIPVATGEPGAKTAARNRASRPDGSPSTSKTGNSAATSSTA